MYRPLRPANASPPTSRTPLNRPSSRTVFSVLVPCMAASFLLLSHGDRGALLETESVFHRVAVHNDGVAGHKIAAQQAQRERVLNQPLDRPPHWPRSVSRIVALRH